MTIQSISFGGEYSVAENLAAVDDTFEPHSLRTESTDYETVVLPILCDQRLLLVSRYRYATGTWSIELPRVRCRDDDGGWKVQVEEQLSELLGLRSERLKLLGAIHVDPAIMPTSAPVVVAESCRPLGSSAGVTGIAHNSVAAIMTLSSDEIDRLVRRGEIACGVTLAALYLCRAQLR